MARDYKDKDFQMSREDEIRERHHWDTFRNSPCLIAPGLSKCENPIHGPYYQNICKNCARIHKGLYIEEFCSSGCYVRYNNGTTLFGERERWTARDLLRKCFNYEPSDLEVNEFIEYQKTFQEAK